MGFLVFILFLIIFAIVYKYISPDQSSRYQTVHRTSYSPEYMDDYDDEAFDDDYDDYSDSETRAARGERDYFTDDPADNYNSYYAQVADDAMMGNRDAMDEMRWEF